MQEIARYTHALLEGVYCRMPFPTCWCVYRLPETLIQRMEARYRAELSQGCPAAANEALFYRGVVEACMTWALSFHRMMRPLGKMLEQDRCLVALTDRQRFLLYLNAAAHASEVFGHLPSIGRAYRARIRHSACSPLAGSRRSTILSRVRRFFPSSCLDTHRLALQIGFDEGVDLAIEIARCVAAFKAGAVVLHQLEGVHHH